MEGWEQQVYTEPAGFDLEAVFYVDPGHPTGTINTSVQPHTSLLLPSRPDLSGYL